MKIPNGYSTAHRNGYTFFVKPLGRCGFCKKFNNIEITERFNVICPDGTKMNRLDNLEASYLIETYQEN